MNSRIAQIALRIALLKEEYKESDIIKAVKLLKKVGTTYDFLDYLEGNEKKSKDIKSTNKKQKPIDKQISQAVIGLEKKEPEKYHILLQFDSLLRKNKILPNLKEIRKLGEDLNKNFQPVKSRREAISKLMYELSNHNLQEINDILQTSISLSDIEDSSYQQLAHFIITGNSSKHLTKL